MITGLTALLYSRFKWVWKPSSLELLLDKVSHDSGNYTVESAAGSLKYTITPAMVALGGMLDPAAPGQALMRYRLAKGEKCFYTYGRFLCRKHPVQLKLEAFAGAPRNSATFLSSVGHWSASMLWEAYRWERRMLVKMFRWRRRADEGKYEFNQRVALKLNAWLSRFKYKPIRAHVLERVHNHFWHEKTVAGSLRAVRVDRDERVW